MAKMPNINCIYYTGNGKCAMPGTQKFFGLFKTTCLEAIGKNCIYIKMYPKPPTPTPPPHKKPLTEGSVRGGNRNALRDYVRPMAPPPPGIAGKIKTKIPHSSIIYTIYSTRKTRERR
jgi:hypothetical protein